MRFRYSDGTKSDDCGHAADDPNCIANGGLGRPADSQDAGTDDQSED